MPVLRVSNLSMSFGGIKALSNINLEVERGEIIGLIGPNGAGKTTFFNLLTGIYSPTEGEIEYNLKKRGTSKNIKPHKIIGYGISRTFQNIRLFKNMTVLENVLIGFHNNFRYGLGASVLRLPFFYKNEKEAYIEAMNLLSIFSLSDKADEFAGNLPYGEQRKLEIARALAAEPQLLLLDEPAAGMNPRETQELMELIKWIKDRFNLTIILIEHDMSLVMNVCKRIFVFDYGILIAQGTPQEIQNNPAVIKAYLGGE
ncbi:ABC transporter ATP-binding protein [Fonticella tunisiensis]|uniref:Amino acid/amide ABC transporter ATP-binding protein 1 (HAAT family) n=1 Tax=Fonticella tunisiensis TaxID=1096341 RepID=A0A4R7KWC4_9CLOT|nr:ABC transporter ATP-binding protein [Fonticella tunisiensis]TDT63280.1 amino acid/amide ABC transporter ATP-binding protein 1 (HAAT family) [Fonticella tunisiensis]